MPLDLHAADDLINELVKREIAKDQIRPREERMIAPTAISPHAALLLGSLADSASTYGFLKAGTGHEANPALGYMNGKPWTVIPSAAAGALAYEGLYRLLKRKHPKLADTLAGLVGGFHGALAGANAQGATSRGMQSSRYVGTKFHPSPRR